MSMPQTRVRVFKNLVSPPPMLGTVTVQKWVVVVGVALTALAFLVACAALALCFILMGQDNDNGTSSIQPAAKKYSSSTFQGI